MISGTPSFKLLLSVSWRTQLVRVLLLLGSTLLLTVLLPNPFGNEYADLREGAVAPRDVDAPFDFEVLKDADQLAQERYDARRTVPSVVEYNDSLTKRYKQQFTLMTTRLESVLRQLSTSSPTSHDTTVRNLVESIYSEYRFYLPREITDWLVEKYLSDNRSITDAFNRWRTLQTTLLAQGILRERADVLDTVVMAKDLSSTGRRGTDSFIVESQLQDVLLSKLREEEPSEELIRAGYALLRPMLAANWSYNAEETEHLRDAIAANVPSAKGIVLKGERIIDRGKRIDDKQIAILNSMQTKRNEMLVTRGFWGQLLPRLGTALAVLLILSIWMIVLIVMRPQYAHNGSRILLGLLLLVLPVLILTVGILPAGWSYLYFPAGAVAMSIAILFDVEIALIGVGMLAGLAGILGEGRLLLVIYSLLAGATAVAIIGRVSTRGHLFRATPVLIVVSGLLVMARAANEMMWSLETTEDLIAGVIIAAATPLLVFGVVYLAEKLFRIPTDLTYLELSDFNRPILRKLAFEAPGTFHHSILVGALAEAGARAVGANPILARCAAYYHDIGKIESHEYFIENQSDRANPHENLSYEESVEILRNHVVRGVALAKELRLPDEIIAAIPEHHGTMVMGFFHSRAVRERGVVNEQTFRYRGPRPRTKENAVLMLADGCEAISRTLKDSGKEELRNAVSVIVRERLVDGQLDHAPLSFLDIRHVESAFVTVLDGILHKRVSYPTAPKHYKAGNNDRDR